MGWAGGRPLAVARSSGLCSRHCRGRAVVQMAGDPPRGQHSSRAGQVSQLAPSHPTCQSWLVYLGLFSVKGQGPKGRSGQKLALCCPLVAY